MPPVALTPRLVATLEPEPDASRTVYFDKHRDAPKGFALRVSDKGGRAFYLLATSKEHGRLWVKIGDAKAVSLDDARTIAQKRAGAIADGKNPIADGRAQRRANQAAKDAAASTAGEWSVADLLRAYVRARLESLSPVTVAEYERILAKDIASSELGPMIARDVLKDDVRRTVTRIAKRGPAVASRTLAFLRAGFRWGMDEETLVTLADGRRVARPRVDRDPTRRIDDELPKVKVAGRRQRERHLSDTEIKPFWAGLDALKLSGATFARLILLCGTRRGETHRARWRDFDLEGQAPAWTIPAEHRKGRAEGGRGARRELVVPLAPLAVELLKDLRQATVEAPGAPAHWREFPFRTMGFSIGLVGPEVKRATGLADVSLHDLRRSTASGLQRIGCPPHVISIVLGHAREAGATATDTAYAHDRRVDEHRLWLERWARHVEGLVTLERKGADIVLIRA